MENVENIGGSFHGYLAHWFSVLCKMWKMLKISVAPPVAFFLICSVFYGKRGKCGKFEKYRCLSRLQFCSLAPCSMENVENVENVKNIGGSLGCSITYWLTVLWKMWKM